MPIFIAAADMANLVKPFLPPIVVPLMRSLAHLVKRPEWQYIGQDWKEDDPRSMGWSHPSVVEAQLRRWPDFVAAVTGSGTLGVSHLAVRTRPNNIIDHNILLTFAYAVARAAAGRGSLSVLDWGGGLGYYAVIARSLFPEIRFDYTVEELPDVCAAGRKLLPEVRFTQDRKSLDRTYDLVFVSSALQYVRDWQALLGQFADIATRWAFVTRLPVTDNDESYVVTQRPHWAGYHTEYMSWVFSRQKMLAEAASKRLTLEREFVVHDWPACVVRGAPGRIYELGFLFSKQI
jgi:putative methyltransferase (TIGR04325 family)